MSRISEAASNIWNDRRRFLLSWFALPMALVAALLLGALLMLALGANPITGYHALVTGAFGGSYALASTAVKAVPLLLVGVGICIAFRANVLNIGGEGQIAMGGLAAHGDRPGVPNLPERRAHPARAARRRRRRRRVGRHPRLLQGLFQRQRDPEHDHAQPRRRPGHELPAGRPMVDKTHAVRRHRPDPRRRSCSRSTPGCPILVHGTQLHLGVLDRRASSPSPSTSCCGAPGFGFRVRAVGLSRDASRYAGMPVKRTMTMALALSGAMCGLAGAMLVFGSISHRMVTDGSLTGFTGNAGFNGIVVGAVRGAEPAVDDPVGLPLRRAARRGHRAAGRHRRADRPGDHHRGPGRRSSWCRSSTCAGGPAIQADGRPSGPAAGSDRHAGSACRRPARRRRT